MFGIHNHVEVTVCKDADDAIAKGFVYRPPFKPLKITKLVVVQDGTEGHHPTVDFLCEDQDVNPYAFAITGNLLLMLGGVVSRGMLDPLT